MVAAEYCIDPVHGILWCLPGEVPEMEQLGYHQQPIGIIINDHPTICFSFGTFEDMGNNIDADGTFLSFIPGDKKNARLYKPGNSLKEKVFKSQDPTPNTSAAYP